MSRGQPIGTPDLISTEATEAEHERARAIGGGLLAVAKILHDESCDCSGLDVRTYLERAGRIVRELESAGWVLATWEKAATPTRRA